MNDPRPPGNARVPRTSKRSLPHVDGAGRGVTVPLTNVPRTSRCVLRSVKDPSVIGTAFPDPSGSCTTVACQAPRTWPSAAPPNRPCVDVAAYSTPPMRAVTAGAASAAGARSRSAAVASTSATIDADRHPALLPARLPRFLPPSRRARAASRDLVGLDR